MPQRYDQWAAGIGRILESLTGSAFQLTQRRWTLRELQYAQALVEDVKRQVAIVEAGLAAAARNVPTVAEAHSVIRDGQGRIITVFDAQGVEVANGSEVWRAVHAGEEVAEPMNVTPASPEMDPFGYRMPDDDASLRIALWRRGGAVDPRVSTVGDALDEESSTP